MLRDPNTARGVPLLFTLGFLAVLLLLYGGRRLVTCIAGVCGQAITCVTGYLRPRPDPWLEAALREAFAELDRDLAAILRHGSTRR